MSISTDQPSAESSQSESSSQSDRPPSQRPTSVMPAPASSNESESSVLPATEPASDASSSSNTEEEVPVQKPTWFKIGISIAVVLAVIAFIVWAAIFNKPASSEKASPATRALSCGSVSFPDCAEVTFEKFREQNSAYTAGPKLDCRGKVRVLKRDNKAFGLDVCKCECKE